MAMRRTKQGRVWVEDPYPLLTETIPEHLWLVLTLSLAEATSQKDFNAKVKSFCEVFDIHPSAVARRFKDEEEAISELTHAKLH